MGIVASFNTVSDLCAELSVSTGDFTGCAQNIKHHVRRKTELKSDGNLRIIYAPSEKLKSIQRGVKDIILKTFDYPEFIYGLGGNTLKQHASVHKGDNIHVKVDIRDFFPSISHNKVYEMWIDDFGFNPEVARWLTKLTTHKGFLQQGFPTSSHIAAIVCLPVTKELEHYCKQQGLSFSQYVDDLNFSGGQVIYRDMFKLVVGTAQKHNFSIKRRKSKVYSISSGKAITGVSVVGNRIRAPKNVRRRAIDAVKALQAEPASKLNQQRVQSYANYLNQLDAVDGKKYKNIVADVEKKLDKK